MRLKQLTNLFNLNRLRRLQTIFKSPFKAFLATAGIFKEPVELVTMDGATMLVSREDRYIWDAYFQPEECEIRIEQGVFQVIPDNKAHPAYSIAPGHAGFTNKPQRWNPACLEIPLCRELQAAERQVYSQHGEDGVLEALLRSIPVSHRYIIEFGAHDGMKMSNSRYLIHEQGWSGLLIEADKRFYAKLESIYRDNDAVKTLCSFVTPENIEQLFSDAGAPEDFEVLSIDIDSIDYYVWEALTSFVPRIVIVEYNSCLAPLARGGFSRDEALHKGAIAGASLLDYDELARAKGYQLVYTELAGGNAFFIHESCKKYFPDTDWSQLTVEKLFQPPQFGVLAGGQAINGRGYDYHAYETA